MNIQVWLPERYFSTTTKWRVLLFEIVSYWVAETICHDKPKLSTQIKAPTCLLRRARTWSSREHAADTVQTGRSGLQRNFPRSVSSYTSYLHFIKQLIFGRHIFYSYSFIIKIKDRDWLWSGRLGFYGSISHCRHTCNCWLTYNIHANFYLHTKFYIPTFSVPLLIAVKLKAKWKCLHVHHVVILHSTKNYLKTFYHTSFQVKIKVKLSLYFFKLSIMPWRCIVGVEV